VLTIRQAELADLDAITTIYNEAILTTTATFDLELLDVTYLQKFLR
jgi:L-amino acid N-acyltransferase YncA